MSEREERLRRDAAAVADAVGRDLDGAFQPLSDHAKRVRDMAAELTLIASRTSRRAERLSAAADAPEPATELLALFEVVRSLAGEVRAMADRSVHDLEEMKGQIVHTVRAAALGQRRRQDRFDSDVAKDTGGSAQDGAGRETGSAD